MAHPRRIVITGATGLIGRALCARLQARGDELVIFSRNPTAARQALPGAAAYVAWTPAEEGPWLSAVDGASAVIHLAGAPIAGHRWSDDYKWQIRESRMLGARGLVNAITAASQRPQVMIGGSGVDYYGARDDTPIDESAPPGSGFLPQVCIEWERETMRAETLGVRAATLRTGIVLDRHEGALARLLLPFQLGVGGPILPGSQWWSWIHLEDELGLIELLLDDDRARGPFNGTAPEPERCRDFAATLGRVLHRPSWLPVPLAALELLLGEMAGPLLVEKQRAIPRKALDLGYHFRFPSLEPALRNILG